LGTGEVTFRRSPHHFQLKGKNAEQFIQQLANKTFLADWCYANPRLPNGKELCDLLVIFDTTALIWQIKDLEPDKAGDLKPSALGKNLRQLSGARRQLFDLRTKIELENPRRGKEVCDVTAIRDVHLISVILSPREKVISKPMRFLEELGGHVAHVFIHDFAEIVLNELDTVSDFCAFLKGLESVGKEAKLVLLSGEEELLAHYLAKGRNFDWINKEKLTIVDDGAWASLQEHEQYIRMKKEDEISYLWDQLIDMAHGGGKEHPQYEKVARELARLSRFDRRLFAKVFMEAHERADSDPYNNVYRRIVPFKDVLFCFLFTHDLINETVRRKLLETTCFVAKGKFRDSSKVVGIATEMKFDRDHRFQFGLLEVPEWNEKHQEHMEKLQRELGILTNIQQSEFDETQYLVRKIQP
jgi:hypothetical protein